MSKSARGVMWEEGTDVEEDAATSLDCGFGCDLAGAWWGGALAESFRRIANSNGIASGIDLRVARRSWDVLSPCRCLAQVAA